MEYNVGTKNRFIGIDSEISDDPMELIREAQSKPKKEKVKKVPKKEEVQAQNEPAQPAVSERPPKGNQNRDGASYRGGRGGSGGRGNRSGGPGRENNDREQQPSRPCFKCQEVGHFAKECPNSVAPPPIECHRCKGPHMIKDCPEPRPEQQPRPPITCHKCSEEGHIARDCQNQPPPQPKGKCHRCNEEGHFARECPTNQQKLECHRCHGFGHFARECQQQSDGGRFNSNQDGEQGFGNSGFGAPGITGTGSEFEGDREEGFGSSNSNNDSGGFSGGFGDGGFGDGGFGSPSNEKDNEALRGRRGGRGGRGGRGRGARLDRRSGNDKSGVRATEKKDGHGLNNWGTPADQDGMQEEQKPDSPEQTDQEEDNTAQTLTYTEWKAQNSNVEKPTYNIRKVEEHPDLAVLKKKNPVEESPFGGQQEYEYKPKSSGRKLVSLDVEIAYGPGANRQMGGGERGRGRGGRGGRGRGTGDFGKTGSEDKENVQFNMDNCEDFPSL